MKGDSFAACQKCERILWSIPAHPLLDPDRYATDWLELRLVHYMESGCPGQIVILEDSTTTTEID